jgi:glycosyltransferase involved in cell wall biosynthesis
MKILHLSTYGSGGGGIAALRLHNALLDAGVDSKYLCLDNPPVGKNIYKTPPFKLSPAQYILRKFGLYKTAVDKNIQLIKGLNEINDFYSFPCTDYDLSEHPLVKEADIINLHWVSNFLDYRFFAKTNKKIVWTLHDMNPFQGGFHYHDELINNKDTYGGLEKKLIRFKKQNIEQCKNLEIVTLCNWMYNESSQSEMFAGRKHHLIRNSIDLSKFKPYNKSFAREIFNLPQDKIVLLFVSESVDSKRKGMDLLLNALDQLDISQNICLAVIGNMTHPIKSKFEIVKLGYLSDERILGLLYSAADAYMLSSREDNLPNVMPESLACGTPVISTPVGGMLDVIQSGFNGILSKDLSSEGIKDAIEEFIKTKNMFDKEKIRQFAVEQFSPEVQAKRYIEIYKELLSKLNE